MIARLRQVRLRLVDAVALAAVAMLALKVAGWLAAPLAPASSGASSEEISPFARVLAHARTNYVAPDVLMTGAVPPKEAEGQSETAQKAPASEEKARPRSFEPSPSPVSASERALLERLGERRNEWSEKDRDLDLRAKLLENAERKLESRINELKALEDKAEGAKTQRGETEAGAMRNLVTMYEAMKPKDAARVFDRLSHDVLVPVVLQMNPRKMAEVLAVMSPEAAEKLTVALANRARGFGVEARPAAANGLPPTELPALEPTSEQPRR